MNKKVCVLICIIIIALLFVIGTNSSYYEHFGISNYNPMSNCYYVLNKEYKSCKVTDNDIQRYQICRTDYTPPVPPVPPVPPKNKCIHGKVVNNKCVCSTGWTGIQCDTPIPPHDPCYGINCGAHGSCQNGKCICTDGWTGFNCQIKPEDPCTNVNCGAHGSCKTGKCICTDDWTGDKCQIKPHDPCDGINCGAHGACTNGQCNCTDGWTGDKCDVPPGGGGKPKAVIVIRHGQKGPNDSDHIQDKNPPIKAPPATPYYFKDALTNPVTGNHVQINFSNLSKTGYNEGTSFATTIPDLISKYAPITRAAVFNPSDNANTYLTAYPLLKELSQSSLKTLDFYSNPSDIENITPTDSDGSILFAGTADTLYKDHDSIISRLNAKYGSHGGELQRGRSIYIYTDSPKKLTQYMQNPSTKSVTRQ